MRQSVVMKRLFSFAAMMVVFFTAVAMPATASALPAKIRLLEGGQDGAATLAALEITLEPGYLTYWRTPGDAGIAPAFDWSASKNVADVQVEWPAPARVLEADSVVYGFHDKVLVPLRVTPKQAGAPVELNLKLDYGVCKDICIPATSTATLTLSGVGNHALIVQQAFEALPEKVALGDKAAPLVILSVKPSGPKELIVTAQKPAGEPLQLFAEGPDDAVLSTSEGQPGTAPETMDFKVILESAGKAGASPVKLTARAKSHAIETEYEPHWQ